MMLKEHGVEKFGRLIDQGIAQARYLDGLFAANKIERMATRTLRWSIQRQRRSISDLPCIWRRFIPMPVTRRCARLGHSPKTCTTLPIGSTPVASRALRWNSTGVYWIPAFEVLDARGFHVILVNARYAKNVPGRKTDVSDAGWLRQLHSYGLLRGSFRPAAEIATLRAYLRQRERLVEYAAAHI